MNLNLKQKAYNMIKENIINCVYEPGVFLNEDFLCRELEMSRTPIRDALGRLETEGMLKIWPKKGIYIDAVTLRDINTVFECRGLLEPYIIMNYCHHLSHEILENLHKSLACEIDSIKSNKKDPYYWDNEFHKILQDQCRNEYFRKMLEEINGLNSRLRVLSGRVSENRLDSTIREHEEILMELMKNNGEKAAMLMKKHLEHSKEAAYACFMIDDEHSKRIV